MSTPLTDSIQNLIDYINEITGGEDANLSDAVATLAEGYGGNGGISIDDIALNKDLGDVVINANEIADYGFNLRKLNSINGPFVESIGTEGIAKTPITNAVFPNAVEIKNSAFYSCTSMVNISIPKVSTIGAEAFYSCTSMVNISIPKVSTIGAYAFKNCSALTKIYLPSCVSTTSITSRYTFSKCTSLSDIYLPKSESNYSGAPWGAPNATIHYDTQFDENGEPILE